MGNGDNVLEDKENSNTEQSWKYKRKIWHFLKAEYKINICHEKYMVKSFEKTEKFQTIGCRASNKLTPVTLDTF